jgi:AraC-like DNA-binding protein
MTGSRKFPFRFEDQNADRITIWVESDGLVLPARDSRAAVALCIDSRSDTSREKSRRPTPLPKWRLKRTIKFIELNIGSPILLSELARAAGLSRMHFAAQFRAATGIRPHSYLLWRRIEKAQTMLATTNAPIVEVALGVGFNTQAHFTGVFKRFAGLTPGQWRRKKYRGGSPLIPSRSAVRQSCCAQGR